MNQILSPQNTQISTESDYYLDSKVNVIRKGIVLEHPKLYKYSQKDPTITYDPRTETWHLYFTNCEPNGFSIGHLTTTDLHGKWQENEPIRLEGITGKGIAAPGVEFFNNRFWLLIQQEFTRPDGNIFTYSSNNGYNFTYEGIALRSIPNSVEAGIYDAAIKQVAGELYLMYSGFPYPYRDSNNIEYGGIHGDIYLAKCEDGNCGNNEWKRVGSIIKHEDVPFHNDHAAPDREWGLEGCDFVELEDKSILLTGVCFLKNGLPGHRQRIFVAHATSITSPFKVIGILSNPLNDWGATENGHPCIAKVDGDIMIYIQFYKNSMWQLGTLVIKEEELKPHLQLLPNFNK